MQFDGQVDLLDDRLAMDRRLYGDRREIENSGDACCFDRKNHRLGRIGWHGQDGKVDRMEFRKGLKLIEALDLQLTDRFSDLLGVGVEGSEQIEALLLESAITAERSAKVPDSDEDDFPNPIGTEDRLDALDQILDLVADTSLPYGPEARDIASDLGVV